MEKKASAKSRYPGKTRTEVRIPDAIWKRLRTRAIQHHRATNGEINQAIEEYLDRLDKEDGKT